MIEDILNSEHLVPWNIIVDFAIKLEVKSMVSLINYKRQSTISMPNVTTLHRILLTKISMTELMTNVRILLELKVT